MPNYEFLDYPQRIEKRILIRAIPLKVWEYLTNPDLMLLWMGDPEMQIEILSDWKVGNSFVIRGFHHIPFENKGIILQFEVGKVFQYDYLSSMSGLTDDPDQYTRITFTLTPKGEQTELIVVAEGFPTEVIYKHLEFYWNGTMGLLKEVIENGNSATLSNHLITK